MKKIKISISAILLLCILSTFAQTPYKITMSVQSDPTTKMGFNWFTTLNAVCGRVEIATGPNAFNSPFKTVYATCNGQENKAVVVGLTPNTIIFALSLT